MGRESVSKGTHGWVESTLTDLDMVQWDRFTVDEADGCPVVTVYGWIERVADDYKDFVVLKFWTESETVGFTTSSEAYTEAIFETLYDESLDEHNGCRRVEDAFGVPNAIELAEDASLAEFAGGGSA